MKLSLIVGLSLVGMMCYSASFAQSSAGWGSKPASLAKSPTLSGSLPNNTGRSLSSMTGNTLTSSGRFGTPAGTTQNTMLSHNHRVRYVQRHTDANNPLLHPQPSSTPGLMSPHMSPMSGAMTTMK